MVYRLPIRLAFSFRVWKIRRKKKKKKTYFSPDMSPTAKTKVTREKQRILV